MAAQCSGAHSDGRFRDQRSGGCGNEKGPIGGYGWGFRGAVSLILDQLGKTVCEQWLSYNAGAIWGTTELKLRCAGFGCQYDDDGSEAGGREAVSIGADLVGAPCLNPTNIARWLTNASGRHEGLRPRKSA